ncbi:MAG TPA: HigA family addiction module antitoxin [Chloroflexia bacterium]|nr:HigA family addiction module antitoxin [Chloroflexia bacterium]
MTRPAIHPGEILADELNEVGISAAALARALHVPTNRITEILNGQRSITADTALRLGRWLGTGPQLWLNLQTTYDLRRTEQQYGEEIEHLIQPRSEPIGA